MPSVQHSLAADYKRQSRDAQSTKLKLINAALNAFTTQGYDASSTRGIENAAGIKRGLINYHFGSKAALWKASADHLMSITEQDLGAAVKEVENLEESQRLRAFVRAYVTFCDVLTGAATLIFSNAAEAEALSGRNPLDSVAVAAHAEAVADLFTPVEKSR